MKLLNSRFTYFCSLIFLIVVNPHVSNAQQPTHLEDGTVLLENFENDEVGNYPNKWYNRRGSHRLVDQNEDFTENYKYQVIKNDNNKFLRYEGTAAKHISLPLINKDKDNIYNINIYETPILSWKVRAHSLPENANEKNDDRNDTVASIYVAFDMGRVALFKEVPKTIRYTWSTTLDEGETDSKLFGNQQIIVVESGSESTGKWIKFERNLVKDYRRMFGDDPPKTPMAIIILSDGDSTGSFVKADYDDIKLKPEK